MEALPKMPMVAPPFRASSWTFDNIPNFDFRMKVKEYILMHFQADPHAYEEAFNDLSAMKIEANNPTASVEGTCLLKRYYGQLCMIQKRFPMAPGQELETPFSWFDSLGETRHPNSEITYGDIEYEKASVMFNIGSAHAQIAANEDRETQDSIKNAFMHFQYAAFAFEKLRKERYEDSFYPSIDLDPNVLIYFEKIMLAQAQECLVQKSLLDNRSHVVISKLSKWLDTVFEECAKLVKDEWNVNVSERVQKYHMRMCQMKSDIYATIAYLSMGDNAETETKKMGYRLAYYTIANSFLNIVLKERSTLERYPELMPTVSFLSDVVQAKLTNAEKENNFIYHERVPKEEDLIEEMKKDGSMGKSKSLAFDPLDRSVCGEDIFGTLLPPTVLQSVSVYEEKKADIKRGVLQDIHMANEELDKFLDKAGYTDLRWMLSEGKDTDKMFAFPDWLLERNAEMTAQPDAIPALLEKLRESVDTSKIAEAKLNTLISKLRSIDLPRLKNDEGYVLISKELDKLNDHLTNAGANNVSLNKAIAAHSTHLQILSLPFHELRVKMMPAQTPKTTTNSKEEIALKRVMDKIEEMKAQRGKLMNQLEIELSQDDISKELLAQRDFSHDDIYEKELKKHDGTLKYIRLNMAAQENILHAFTEANADFCEERMQINKSTENFNEQARVLSNSYDIFKDVASKVADGEKFYRQLMQRCDQFAIPIHAMEEEFRSEVEKREFEKREIDERMNAMRRQKEARDAMAEFRGVDRRGQPNAPMGYNYSVNSNTGPNQTPVANPSHPRLRDFMDQYRSKKAGGGVTPSSPIPSTLNSTYAETPILGISTSQTNDIPGPPSPTPSSINEFPISPSVRNVGRQAQPPSSQRIFGQQGSAQHGNQQFPPNFAPPPNDMRRQTHNIPTSQYRPGPNAYQPVHRPADPYSDLTNQGIVYKTPGQSNYPVQNSIIPYISNSNVPYQTGGYQQQGFQPISSHLPQFQGVHNAVQQPIPPHPPMHQSNSSNQSQQSHPPNFQSQYSNQSNHSSQSIPAVVPSHTNVPSPSTNAFQPPVPSPVPVQSHDSVYTHTTFQHGSSATPLQTNSAHPSSIVSHTISSINNGFAHQTDRSPNIPPTQSNQYYQAPSQIPPVQQVFQSQGYHAQSFPVNNGSQQHQFNAPTSSIQPSIPNHSLNPSPAPVLQNPSSARTELPPTINNEVNQVPNTQQKVPASKPTSNTSTSQVHNQNTVFDSNTFNVGNGTSPWHSAPSQFKASPWHAGVQQNPANSQPQPQPQTAQPQQHLPTPMRPQSDHPLQQVQQQTNSNNSTISQAPRSNVDLLGDLLGDFNFNLAPPLQPTVQNSQNLQKASDFPVARTHLEPDKPISVVNRPAATVMPMPHQQTASIATSPMIDAPILTMNSASTVSFHSAELKNHGASPSLSATDVTDPMKFALGEGHMQKLEKRLLHHSIRTNGPPPPMNPNDPLNQINAFAMLQNNKKQ